MKFCSNCAATLVFETPPGDHLPRYCCKACGVIHYQNPRNVVGCIPVWQDKVLLCRRGIEPRLGFWTLPAGFLENDESLDAGAARETREEACASVTNLRMFTVLSVPRVNQAHIMFLADMTSPDYALTPESTEIMLCDEANVPWDEIAFRTIKTTLKHFFADRKAGQFGVHYGVIS